MNPAVRTAILRRTSRLGVAAAMILCAATLGARAQDAPLASSSSSCEADIGKLQQKRNAEIGELNKLSKKGGKLDPVAACPKLRNLAATEKQMLAYMEKNQNWCSIPDSVIENVKQGSGKTAGIAGQACKIAAQVEKMKKQQAAGGGAAGPFGAPTASRLPTGPL